MQLLETIAHLFHPRHSNKHRARVLHPEAFVFLIAIAIGFVGLVQGVVRWVPGAGGILGFASNITPQQVIDQTNQQRAAAGLSSLTANGTLSQAALLKAQDMMQNQYWAHNSPAGKKPWDFMRQAGYSYSVAGENLARDFGDTSEMMSAWMASPTHRANIVNGRYQEIGVAVVDGVLEGVETTLVVQMFGAHGAAKPQVAETGTTTATPKPAATLAPNAVPTPLPSASPELIVLSSPLPVVELTTATPEQPTAVLASTLVPRGNLANPPLFSPLQLSKAFFLAIVMLLMLTLIYDTVIVTHRSTLRFVGKNLAHLLLLGTVAYVLIFFRGGIVQ